MSGHHPQLLAAACLLVLCPITDGQPTTPDKTTRTDLYGDPLPAGAVARMGTVRFRAGDRVGQVAFSADSKMLAAASSGVM